MGVLLILRDFEDLVIIINNLKTFSDVHHFIINGILKVNSYFSTIFDIIHERIPSTQIS